jgi:putative flippase GtrA
MTFAQNRLIAPLWQKLRTKVGVRFTRFAGVALLALATSEIMLSICNGVLHMSSTPAALISTFSGAVVSYVLSRWAWERRGKPDVLRETVPFYVITAMVWVILWLATKLGYHMASWMHLSGFKHVLLVDFVYLVANFVTFLLRFVIFHYVLFAERTTAARAAATGPDAVPPGTRHEPRPAEAPHSTASTAPAEARHAVPAATSAANGTQTSSTASGTSAAKNSSTKRTSDATGTASASARRGKSGSQTPPAASPTSAE